MPDESINNNEAEKVAVRLNLEGMARVSFIKLCDKGCNAHFLAEYLPYIKPESVVALIRKNKTGKCRPINIRPLDSHENAFSGFEKRDLEALQEQLLKVAKQIQKLNRTRLVRYTDNEEYNTEIHRIPHLLTYYSKVFLPFLIHKYEVTGDRQRPQFTEYLNAICDHVQQSTGKPHNRLISEVLTGIGVEMDEFALKQGRSRNKVRRTKE